MKKFFITLLPLLVVMLTFSSCMKEEVSDVVVEYHHNEYCEYHEYDDFSKGEEERNRVSTALHNAFSKSGMEKIDDQSYVLRSQTSTQKAKSITAKCIKEFEQSMEDFNPKYLTSAIIKVVIRGFGEPEVVYEKDICK